MSKAEEMKTLALAAETARSLNVEHRQQAAELEYVRVLSEIRRAAECGKHSMNLTIVNPTVVTMLEDDDFIVEEQTGFMGVVLGNRYTVDWE